MYLSKYVLTRDNQKLILQGMIHVAPARLYEFLQKDMDNKANEGYKILFEDVKDYPELRPGASRREREIAKLFKTIFRLYPILASAWGFKLQKEKIKYPEGAVNIDISFRELVRLLKKRGFRCGFILFVLKGILENEKSRKKFKDDLSKMNPLEKQRKGFGDFLHWLFVFRKLDSVVLDYRNKVAIDMIEEHSTNRNIQKMFVHYGEAHISGMLALLKKRDWRINSSSKLDISTFRDTEY